MPTITHHNLPATITIGRASYAVTWSHNDSLDGFDGSVTGAPIDDYESSEDLEYEVYRSTGYPSDAYADGRLVLHAKV